MTTKSKSKVRDSFTVSAIPFLNAVEASAVIAPRDTPAILVECEGGPYVNVSVATPEAGGFIALSSLGGLSDLPFALTREQSYQLDGVFRSFECPVGDGDDMIVKVEESSVTFSVEGKHSLTMPRHWDQEGVRLVKELVDKHLEETASGNMPVRVTPETLEKISQIAGIFDDSVSVARAESHSLEMYAPIVVHVWRWKGFFVPYAFDEEGPVEAASHLVKTPAPDSDAPVQGDILEELRASA